MKARQIRYGGSLVKGDFIAISLGNHLDFGWYIGAGQNNTVQYYEVFSVGKKGKAYENFLNNPSSSLWHRNVFKNGFTIKCLWKSYINSVHETRVCKINPFDVFTEIVDLEAYKKSEEILMNFNFLN